MLPSEFCNLNSESDSMPYPQTLETFASLQPGDRVEVTHEVKVGFRNWNTTTLGTVVSKDRRRHCAALQPQLRRQGL